MEAELTPSNPPHPQSLEIPNQGPESTNTTISTTDSSEAKVASIDTSSQPSQESTENELRTVRKQLDIATSKARSVTFQWYHNIV